MVYTTIATNNTFLFDLLPSNSSESLDSFGIAVIIGSIVIFLIVALVFLMKYRGKCMINRSECKSYDTITSNKDKNQDIDIIADESSVDEAMCDLNMRSEM